MLPVTADVSGIFLTDAAASNSAPRACSSPRVSKAKLAARFSVDAFSSLTASDARLAASASTSVGSATWLDRPTIALSHTSSAI